MIYGKYIQIANDLTLQYIFRYNIVNKTDITNLFIHFCFTEIINLYKNTSGLVAFYFSQDLKNKMEESDCEIKYKKFLKIILKTLKLPLFISTFSYETVINLLRDDSPEYEEMMNEYKMMSEIYPKLVDTVKKLKFYKIEKEVVSDIKGQIKLISVL